MVISQLNHLQHRLTNGLTKQSIQFIYVYAALHYNIIDLGEEV